VSALLTGVFNNRMPQPKYTFIWDVEKVVRFLSNLGKNTDLDISTLSKKLTMLIALTSAARAHEICFLDIRYLTKHHSGYTFTFGNTTKVAKQGRPRAPIKFIPFEENLELCVCKCIDVYLEKTVWRGVENQLLLSYIRPHKPVSTRTVSRWLTDVLKLSGIDTDTFTGHSTRSAASSKAKFCGVPIKEIF